MAIRFTLGYVKSDDTPIVTAPPFTFCCWYRAQTWGLAQTLMSVALSSATKQYFSISTLSGDPDQYIGVFIRAGGAPVYAVTTNSASSAADPQPWHHVCGVFAAIDSRSIYLDGDVANKGTSAVSVSVSTPDRVALGMTYDSTPSDPLNGDLAEPTFWNVALTEAEIITLAGGVSALFVRPAAIVSHRRLLSSFTGLVSAALVGSDELIGGTDPPTTVMVDADHPRLFQPVAPQTVVPPIVKVGRRINGPLIKSAFELGLVA